MSIPDDFELIERHDSLEKELKKNIALILVSMGFGIALTIATDHGVPLFIGLLVCAYAVYRIKCIDKAKALIAIGLIINKQNREKAESEKHAKELEFWGSEAGQQITKELTKRVKLSPIGSSANEKKLKDMVNEAYKAIDHKRARNKSDVALEVKLMFLESKMKQAIEMYNRDKDTQIPLILMKEVMERYNQPN